GRGQVPERCGRRRVSQVVSRNVHSLKRSNRAFLSGSNPFLKRTHLRGEGWLVTHGASGAAEQSRYFRAGLRKTQDVVNEEQHILVFLVAEVLGNGKAGQGDAQGRTRWFVHLAVDEGDLALGEFGLPDDSRFRHV